MYTATQQQTMTAQRAALGMSARAGVLSVSEPAMWNANANNVAPAQAMIDAMDDCASPKRQRHAKPASFHGAKWNASITHPGRSPS